MRDAEPFKRVTEARLVKKEIECLDRSHAGGITIPNSGRKSSYRPHPDIGAGHQNSRDW
jgi:hypothetical protein